VKKMNIKKFLVGMAAGTLMLGVMITPAFAVGTNGSFEFGSDPGMYTTLNIGSTNINGWTINSGSIDYIGAHWEASDGIRSIDMNGNEKGSISQSFSTTLGARYKVTFDLSGNPDGDPNIKLLTVSAASESKSFSYDINHEGTTRLDMKYAPQSFTFTATGINTTLTFASAIEGYYGPVLDKVVVEQMLPTNKDQCKKDGWKAFGIFKNQGDCVSYVATREANSDKDKADKNCDDGKRFIETVMVPSNESIISAKSEIKSTETYLLKARGTYVYATWAGNPVADAKCSYRGTADPLGLIGWVSGDNLPVSYTHYLETKINGSVVDWGVPSGTCSPKTNQYSMKMTGVDRLDFNIYDGGAVSDNSGNIRVDIYAVCKNDKEEEHGNVGKPDDKDKEQEHEDSEGNDD
jgi:choice-of-anchor C domain-containing protein